MLHIVTVLVVDVDRYSPSGFKPLRNVPTGVSWFSVELRLNMESACFSVPAAARLLMLVLHLIVICKYTFFFNQKVKIIGICYQFTVEQYNGGIGGNML